MSSGPLLQVEGLSRSFGGLAALRGLSFDVRAGEIVGLIGPNGGARPRRFAARPPTGYLGRAAQPGRGPWAGAHLQSAATYPDETVAGNVYRGLLSRIGGTLLHRLSGRGGSLAAGQVAAEVDAILDLTDLRPWRDAPAGSLAYGLQKRLGIAVALAARPRMLLLDEPAAGLNHEECNELGRLLTRLRQEQG